jgi:hypothetical protein
MKKLTQDQYIKKMSSYGFEVGGTGGNCTAFWRNIKLGEKELEVLIANQCEVPQIGEWAVVQFTLLDGCHSNFSFILKDHNAVLEFARTLETN